MDNKESLEDRAVKDVLTGGMFPEDGMILVDKPMGISSFGVVAKIRGMLKARLGHKVKVGHTGTLDPFATGLLILLTGKMTKKSAEFLKLDKEYVATMKLGYISTTGDPEGEIRPYPIHNSVEQIQGDSVSDLLLHDGHYEAQSLVCSSLVAHNPQRSVLESVIRGFVGKIEQSPPRYSAIKINGERAYKLARKGVEFEIPKREVEIYRIDILRYEWPELEIKCFVSSGTYIRTLAEDIGEALGVGAYLTALRRTRVGEYDVKDARQLDGYLNN